ncbi:hypothetical protein PF011_g23878 [Phytophthora fragariae]|uniref:Uncharacterized protein n=1 Tax=Phytophthora fragariae TaxID=53985 RepID=A0A6A3DU43_9STRA|nr:hypothetical protein PF009_g24655 [Phytophthora fragariae]KAE8976877.1 hypothetical protein PF011_g23878 [Phytophthora fragariae]
MLKLEATDEESGEEEGEGDSYGGEIDSSLNWYLQHEAVPMNGIQETKSYSASKSTREELSRKLGELFGLDVPPMVHVCAVQESAPVVKYWRQLDTDVVSLDAIEIYPTFVGSGVPELTAALARTRTVTLQLSLRDEQIPQPKQGLSIVNAGFMLSSVFCGRSICKPYNPHSNIATTQQVEGVTDLELRLSLEQGTPFGGICSALAESTSITELAVRLGVEDDELGLSHWAWLAYACWGHPTAKGFDRSVSVSPISLSAQDVSIVQQVLKNCYPQPVEERGVNPQYGFVRIRAGSELRPCGLGNEDNTTLILERDCRFRALYDPIGMQNYAEVVIPGYGLCQVDLVDGVNVFARDTAEMLDDRTKARGSLRLNFHSVESGRVVTDLLAFDCWKPSIDRNWRDRR